MTSLSPEHPDFNAQPGDTREALGRVWTFGRNQYSEYWRAGPKDGTVSCSRDYPAGGLLGPYNACGANCKDFEAAATRARNGARKDYERAKEIVQRYEADDEKPVCIVHPEETNAPCCVCEDARLAGETYKQSQQ